MKFKIGDKVRCVESTARKGMGWKECLEFTIDHFRPADSFTTAVYFPKDGHGVYEDALELVKTKELPKSFGIKQDQSNPLWNKYIAWLNHTYIKAWSGDCYNYYGITKKGIVDCNYTDYHFDQILTLEEWNEIVNGKQEKQNNVEITRKQLKDIHDVACSTWKKKIETEYATRNPWGDTIKFTQTEIDAMFGAATIGQKEVLEGIFGKQQGELDLRSNDINLKVDGLPVFGRSCYDSYESLIGLPLDESMKNVFYLNKNYEWVLKGNKLTVTRK